MSKVAEALRHVVLAGTAFGCIHFILIAIPSERRAVVLWSIDQELRTFSPPTPVSSLYLPVQSIHLFTYIFYASTSYLSDPSFTVRRGPYQIILYQLRRPSLLSIILLSQRRYTYLYLFPF
jgi:hypothetical protein